MKCPECQAENRDNAQFCRVCGQSLSTELTCAKCGHVNLHDSRFCDKCGQPFALEPTPPAQKTPQTQQAQPTSFANGWYVVKKFLGEGGKKKVYLVHDTVPDRDVAFALIKTEKLDEAARTRIKREAQAMGRLDHPNIVSILDFGEHEGQPYMVLPFLSGGDVEGLIKKAPDHHHTAVPLRARTNSAIIKFREEVDVDDLQSFLHELMSRRRVRPSQLAAALGISHATVSRWLSGSDLPSVKSCHKLAQYSEVPVHHVLSIVGHLPATSGTGTSELPTFREYARRKYPDELDDDLITLIEGLIERLRRRRMNDSRSKNSGS